MKRSAFFRAICVCTGLLSIPITVFSQPFNPFVSNINYTPMPGGSGFECGSTLQLTCTMGLTTVPDAPLVANDSMEVTICISGFDWDGISSSIVSGSYSSNFNWSFDPVLPSCLVGTQNTTLTGNVSGDILIDLLVPAGITSTLSANIDIQPASYMNGTNFILDDTISIVTPSYCPPCPSTVNFTIPSTTTSACVCSSTNGYMDFSSIPYTNGANPSDTIYDLTWPGQPDVDVYFNSISSDIHGSNFSSNYINELQIEYEQFLGYDNTSIPHLRIRAPRDEVVEVVYDFEYAHQNFDLLIYDIDRYDTLVIEAKDAYGNTITDLSNWTVLSYGDLTSYTKLSPDRASDWDPSIGQLSYPIPALVSVPFIALRPDVAVSEISLNFQAGPSDLFSEAYVGLYGWGACTTTLDVDLEWTGILPTDAVVRLDGTDTYIPIQSTASSPHTLQFQVLADGGTHSISTTNAENDCIYNTVNTYLSETSCQEYCSITFDQTITNASSCAANDGEVIISATGGSTPYEYSIDAGVTWQSSNTFSNLSGNTKVIIAVRNSEGTCLNNNINVINSRNTLLQVGDGIIACRPDSTDVTLGIKKFQSMPMMYGLDSVGYDISHSVPETTAAIGMWETTDFGGHDIFSTAINPYSMDIYAATSSVYNMLQTSVPRVYAIDAINGVSTMLVELPGNYGLAGIDYDSLHFQIFASNMDDGKIYRISGAGTILSEFDPLSPDDGVSGHAPRGERVTAVTVNYAENKLYYGIWSTDFSDTGNPNTIRSVGLTSEGDFIPGTDQLEITLPNLETTNINPNTYSMPVFDIQFNNTGTTMLLAESGFNDLTTNPHKSRVLQYDGASNSWVRDNTLAPFNTLQKFELGYINGGSGARGGVAFAYQDTDASLESTTGDYSYYVATGDALTGADCDDYIKGCAYGLHFGGMTGGNPNSSVIYDIDNYVYNDVNEAQDKGYYGDIDIVLGTCDILKYDFGDLPDTSLIASPNNYNTEYHHDGPYHQIIEGLSIGNMVDADSDAIPSMLSNGDDLDGIDDEDGIFFSNTNPSLGETVTISILATNTTGTTSHLEGWIDWNGNGDFTDAGEKIVDLDDSSGSMPGFVTVTVPVDANANTVIGSRFRISHSDNMLPTGFESEGEVEEYALEVQSISYKIGNYVWLDEDGDGDMDAGEQGIGGVPVYLYDLLSNLIASTVTDFNGGYVFDATPSTYLVVVDDTKLPTGLNNQTYDKDGALDHSYIVTLNEDLMDVDFGYNYVPISATNNPTIVNGAIGNRIWSDDDSDGVQDDGEVGIGGVSVMLFDDTSALIETVVTNVAGYYVFDNIPAGVYYVEVDDTTLPTRFNNTPTGDPDGDSDNTTELFVLAPGDVIVIDDFGYHDSSAHEIGNLVYLDSNANGTFDVGELPLSGVTVALIDDTNSNGIWDVGELPIATTRTNAAGNYLFNGAGSGDYVVVITDSENALKDLNNTADPDGGNNSFAGLTIINFNNLIQDFGFTPYDHTSTDGLIGDYIFLDADRDNTMSNADSGIEGVVVNLYDNGNELLETAVTNRNGLYLFGSLPADTYRVEINAATLPAGLQNSVDPDGGTADEAIVVLISGEQNLNQDFGYQAIQNNTISGTIWKDIDGNGTLDESSPTYFENVTVLLKGASENLLATAITDANGDYSFTGIPDGAYFVDVTDDNEILNGFWKSNGVNAGANNNSQFDTYLISITGGTTDETADFGYFIDPASIGNKVWLDRNSNGIQDEEEVGMPGVVVNMQINYTGGVVITTETMTDAYGFYSFDNLLLDEDYIIGDGSPNPVFTLKVTTPPTNFLSTIQDVNSNGNDREDADNITGVFAIPYQGQENVVSLPSPTSEIIPASYDFGLSIDCSAPLTEYAITGGAISNPGQTTDYFYTGEEQDTLGLQLPLHNPEVQEFGALRASDYCLDGAWRYYFNPLDPDEYLFAIEHGSNVTEIQYIELRVADTPSNRYAVNATDATFVMARDWYVRTVDDAPLEDAVGNPATVNIRFYFPEEEFEELLNAATNQAVNVWGVNAPTASNVYWFKRADFNPGLHINPTGTLLKPFDITALQNATTSPLGVNTADGIVGSIGNAKNHIQFNGIDGFSGGTAAITMNINSLPVELSSFEAETDACDVLLKWESESEIGFSHYIVEKSFDGERFTVLGTVAAQTGNEIKKYLYEDLAVRGTHFYRLKMIDFDGAVNYSDILSVDTDCDSEIGDILVYPNPVSSLANSVTIEFESKEATVFVNVVDKLGKHVLQFPVDANLGNNVLSLDISSLMAGTYYVNLQFHKSKMKTARFIKVEN